MNVEPVSFRLNSSRKVVDKVEHNNYPFLYMANCTTTPNPNKYAYSLLTAIISAGAVIITLLNIKKRL
jgi:hypothetical protein